MSTVTREQVIEIVGHLSDARIAEIIATSATPAQVTEAFAWLSADEHLGGDLEKPLAGVVAEVYEILRDDEIEPDEDR